MTTNQIRWQHSQKERFYQIYIQKDLFGDLSMICIWGSLRSRLGNYKKSHFKTIEEANEFIEDMKKIRSKRGYAIHSSFGTPESARVSARI